MNSPCSKCIVFPMCRECCGKAISFSYAKGDDKYLRQIRRRQRETVEKLRQGILDDMAEMLKVSIDSSIVDRIFGRIKNDKT